MNECQKWAHGDTRRDRKRQNFEKKQKWMILDILAWNGKIVAKMGKPDTFQGQSKLFLGATINMDDLRESYCELRHRFEEIAKSMWFWPVRPKNGNILAIFSPKGPKFKSFRFNQSHS